GQEAPAPPAAQPRPLAPGSRAGDVPLDGAVLLRSGGAVRCQVTAGGAGRRERRGHRRARRGGAPAAAAPRAATRCGTDPVGPPSSTGGLSCELYRYLAGNPNL